MISLRQYHGKQLLAWLRCGDYAHAGEEEAICYAMEPILKQTQTILDIGCGLGGTVHFLQQQGWGNSSGMDIEESAIEYAKAHYPKHPFYIADVNKPSTFPNLTYDILCLFNVFYAIDSQLTALRNFTQLAHQHTQLILFDYASELTPTKLCHHLKRQGQLPFKPINLNKIDDLLQQAGWQLTCISDQTQAFHRWYCELVSKLHSKKQEAIAHFGQKIYDKADHTYSNFVNALAQGYLQGTIVYATR